MAKMTSAYANKVLKKLNDDKDFYLNKEQENGSRLRSGCLENTINKNSTCCKKLVPLVPGHGSSVSVAPLMVRICKFLQLERVLAQTKGDSIKWYAIALYIYLRLFNAVFYIHFLPFNGSSVQSLVKFSTSGNKLL